MKTINFSVDKAIFDKFPKYRRAIVVVAGADNSVNSDLENDIANLAIIVQNEITTDDPRIVSWREAFSMLGIKARDFRPSIDALVRRIHNNKPLGSINPIVDIGTLVSLKFVLPAGAHPILDDTQSVRLCLAEDNLVELSDGMHAAEEVPLREVILLDNERVATRRWVWRQTSQSRIDNKTTNFFLNIDALEVIDEQELVKAIELSKELIQKLFGCESTVVILSTESPNADVEISD